MKIKTKEFLDILKHLHFVFMKNNYIEDSNYIYFNTIENIIWTYSDKIIYVHNYKGNLKEEFSLSSNSIAIDAKKLYTLLNKTKCEEIAISESEDSFVIKMGKSTSQMAIVNRNPNNSLLEIKFKHKDVLPEKLKHLFSSYIVYDKEDVRGRNILFENCHMVSTDRFNFVNTDLEYPIPEFACTWNIIEHISSSSFDKIAVFGDYISFAKEGYYLTTKNTIGNRFDYSPFFEEDILLTNAIHINKDEDISYIDAFISDYKKLDKKIIVNILNGEKMKVFIKGNNGTEKTTLNLSLKKYIAGVPEKFEINVDYFKDLYYNYDYFVVGDGTLRCVNVEDMVERIIAITNLGD